MKRNYFLLVFLVLSLCGCSTQSAMHSVQVEVADDVFVSLPKPIELGSSLSVSQLITAQWGEKKAQKLLVQLQVDAKQVVIAGFSAWGARLLSINYSNDQINTYVLTGLADKLPKPEQVLFNVMLCVWPIDAWEKPLQKIGWRLIEKGLKRQLLDKNGQLIVDITYQTRPYIKGVIKFKHHVLGYTITIETNK